MNNEEKLCSCGVPLSIHNTACGWMNTIGYIFPWETTIPAAMTDEEKQARWDLRNQPESVVRQSLANYSFFNTTIVTKPMIQIKTPKQILNSIVTDGTGIEVTEDEALRAIVAYHNQFTTPPIQGQEKKPAVTLKEVEELNTLEDKLIDAIANSNHQGSMNAFLEWQEKRNDLNDNRLTLLEQAINDAVSKSTPTPQGQQGDVFRWQDKPFSVDLLWNNEHPVGEDAKAYMGESYEPYVKNYKEKEDAVIFSNTYVSYDSCDCSEYGCSHGSWPFEITFSENDEKYKGEFEDETALYLTGPKNHIRIEDYTKITMGEFASLCELTGIKLIPKTQLPPLPEAQPDIQGDVCKFVMATKENLPPKLTGVIFRQASTKIVLSLSTVKDWIEDEYFHDLEWLYEPKALAAPLPEVKQEKPGE